MPKAQSPEIKVGPEEILQATFAFARTRILATAVELDLFTRIESGEDAVESLAQATASSPRGLGILLDALAGYEYLEKAKGRYILPAVSRTYLSKKSPRYMGGLVLHSNLFQEAWSQLPQIVRSGRPVGVGKSDEDRGEFFAQFVDALYVLNSEAAEIAAAELCRNVPDATLEVLDVGAGSGVWSLALARRSPRVRVVVADWPAVIEKATRKFAAREGVADRYEYWPGNFRDADFGESRFHVAILGHVCHSEGAQRSRELFRRLHRALRTGGRILVAEILPDESRRQATFPLLFAVNMLVNTEEGGTFTFGEFRQWLEEAGFGKVRQLDAPAPSPLILATKT